MPPIANRNLKLRRPEGDVEVLVRVFAPEPEDRAYSCRYEIDWPEGRETMTAWGADSMQALIISLQMIGADLYSSSYHKAGQLVYDAPGSGYGFPVAPTLKDLLQGDDVRFFG